MQLKIWYRHHDDGQYDAWVGDFESIAAAEKAFADDELFVCATDDLDSEFPPHLVESYDSGTGIYTLKGVAPTDEDDGESNLFTFPSPPEW